MNTKLLLWSLFLCCVFLTANFVFFIKSTGCMKQCICTEIPLDDNHRPISAFRENIKTKTNAGEDGDLQVDIFSSNVNNFSKSGESRSRDRSNHIKKGANAGRKPIGLVPLSDFVKYPCLPGSNKSGRLRSLNRCIRTVNVQLVAETVKSAECVKLNVGTSIPICIHDPRIDIYVSGFIFATGGWEKELLKTFVEALNKVQDIVVLDIGCNIGVYTLVAAKEGKRVVSIDANVQNLILLSKSLILGQFRENVTLIWNALSDNYTNVTLKTNLYNVGGFAVNTDNKSVAVNDVIIETILLDDLIYLFKDKPVGIKMDVESFELQVLKGGVTFLKKADVRYIQMEFARHREKESGQSIVNIILFHGFTPFANCLRNRNIVDLPLKDWPYDVCFVKNIY